MNKILLAYFKRRRWEFYCWWRLKLNRSNASNPATYTEPYQPDSTQNRRRFAKLFLSLSLSLSLSPVRKEKKKTKP